MVIFRFAIVERAVVMVECTHDSNEFANDTFSRRKKPRVCGLAKLGDAITAHVTGSFPAGFKCCDNNMPT